MMSNYHIAKIQTKGKSWRKNNSKEPEKKRWHLCRYCGKNHTFGRMVGGISGIWERMKPLPEKKPVRELLQNLQG